MPGDPTFQRLHGAIDGYVLVPWYDPEGDAAGLVVLDSEGCSRWSTAVSPVVTVAKWSGSEVWYNQMGDAAALHHVDMLTGAAETIDTPGGHHDFVLHSDGTIAWLAEELRTIDGEGVVGDVIRERAPDGTLTDVWNAFDDLEIHAHAQWDVATPHDWTHANGLAYTEATGRYLVSLLWLKEVIEVDVRSGRHTESLIGAAVTEPFGPQHAPSPRPGGGVRLFDNGLPGLDSRLLELRWDGEILWEWAPEDALSTPVLGDLHAADAGITFASFGAKGVVLAVQDDVEIWRVAAPGVVIGRVDWRAALPE